MSQRTTGQISKVITLAAGEEKTIWKVKDEGENLFILLFTDYFQMAYTILIDNIAMAYGRFDYIQPAFIKTYQGGPDATRGLIGGPGIWLAQYDDSNDNYGIIINLPLKWKVSMVIKAKNQDSSSHDVQASMIYDQLEEVPSLAVPKPDLQAPTEEKPWWWPF